MTDIENIDYENNYEEQSVVTGFSQLFFVILSVAAIIEIFFTKKNSDLFELITFLTWYILIETFNYKNQIFLYVFLSLAFLIPIFLVIEMDIIAQKLAIWIFYFICTKSILLIINMIRKRNKD